eukprot:TRINITY_DN4213_c0_g4_i4.p1 TRINITY_DN4213_c0_g4~~TRINITY_DN4213_c0_g4_i4.p1  ORF type:complete len:174 (-),score=25.17 TRINITY_DN4213_c0_g4_i4:213-734(-)
MSSSSSSKSLGKVAKYLLPHEKDLLKNGDLENVSHEGASSLWLSGKCSEVTEGKAIVYRVMGDIEFQYLLSNNVLPDTQPYQTIVEGQAGLEYCEKYLNGKKWVDSIPTTVVEFECPAVLIEHLFKMQSKIEDGVISHGLGNKGGKGLPIFNQALTSSDIMWKIVRVKRSPKK